MQEIEHQPRNVLKKKSEKTKQQKTLYPKQDSGCCKTFQEVLYTIHFHVKAFSTELSNN